MVDNDNTINRLPALPWTPPSPPWDPDAPPPFLPTNRYGIWDGRGNMDNPMCRYTEPLYLCSLCGDNTPADPVGLVLNLVKFAHFLAFVAPIFMLVCIYLRLDVIKKRVYSPLGLILASAIFEAASMAEYASHTFTMGWNACYDTADTPMKMYFYLFTSVGFTGLTMSYRKKDNPLFRAPSSGAGIWIWVVFITDWFLILVSVTSSLVYTNFGKKLAMLTFITVQSFSALVGIFRIWKNLGPSQKLLYWGAASQLMSICGVVVNIVMQRTGAHWKHGLLGLLFSLNEFGIGYCLYICEDISPKPVKNKNENDDTAHGEKTSLL